jgi:hypothetical protein
MDFETPGRAATFRAPGMWLTANSANGRASSTTALRSARTRLNSSVESSAVFCPGVPTTASKTLGGACAGAAVDVDTTRRAASAPQRPESSFIAASSGGMVRCLLD